MFWEIHVPKHKGEKTVFCFLSHDLAIGPTCEFEHRSLNTPANAQVMRAINQEHDSSERMMMTVLWLSQTWQELIVFKINRHNVTKEALLWCDLPQRFLDGVLVRVTKVRHVHPSWTRSFLNSPETKFAHMDGSTKTFLSQHLENWILFLPLICKNFTWKFEYVPLRCTHLFIHNLHRLI